MNDSLVTSLNTSIMAIIVTMIGTTMNIIFRAYFSISPI